MQFDPYDKDPEELRQGIEGCLFTVLGFAIAVIVCGLIDMML